MEEIGVSENTINNWNWISSQFSFTMFIYWGGGSRKIVYVLLK